jgi:sugar lactone lactonase YvrE
MKIFSKYSNAPRFLAVGGLAFLLGLVAACGDSASSTAAVPAVAAPAATVPTSTVTLPVLLIGNTRGNNVVSVDQSTGAYIKDFIAAGSGGLTDPDDLSFGPDGNLYVSSGTNTDGQILRYDGKTGAFLGVFAQGSGMKRPYGNAFGPDGNLYVASFRSDQILKFDGTTGAFISVFAKGDGTAGGLLNGPNDILFGPGGKLYVTTQGSVADGTGSITYKFDSQVLRYDVATGAGEVFAPAPTPTPNGGGYISLLGLVFGPDGLLYTSDFGGGIRSYNTATKALVQTIDTGKLFGGTVATTVGNMTFGSDGSLYAPVFNGNFVANGLAKCSVAGTGSCQLLATNNVNLVRPIGIATPAP